VKYLAHIEGVPKIRQSWMDLVVVQVCGEAEVWGDGIVPLPSAHLDSATNVDLDGVYHSPLGASKV
jgi:hypothetical protein